MADVNIDLESKDSKQLFNQGVKAFILRDYKNAVDALGRATEIMVAELGDDLHDSLGDPYLYYGKSLLALYRHESDPIGNLPKQLETSALEDQEEEAADNEKNEDKDETQENNDNEEKDENKESNGKHKDGDGDAEANGDETKDDDAENGEEEEEEDCLKVNDPEKSGAADESFLQIGIKRVTVIKKRKSTLRKVGFWQDKHLEEHVQKKKVKAWQERKWIKHMQERNPWYTLFREPVEPDEDEEPSDLQVAWEVLELAKKIFEKRGDDGKKAYAETLTTLGEISLESENYIAAINDFIAARDIQIEVLPDDSRMTAETFYNLGVAFASNTAYKEGMVNLKKSIEYLERRIRNLEGKKENLEEVQEMKDLIPEIYEKIRDLQVLTDETKKKLDELTKQPELANKILDAATSSSSSSSSKQATDISHLVKRKRKAEENDEESNPPKKCPQ